MSESQPSSKAVKKPSEKQRRDSGDCYLSNSSELRKERIKAKSLCHDYNALPVKAVAEKSKLLYGLLGACKKLWVEPPFYCDYGYNIYCGDNFYANHGVVILDAAPVTFGDNVLLGPGVNISTATHPLNAKQRLQGGEIAKPIVLGNNVWVGMGAQILPGVTIGDNAVVAAGAVVSRDVPANALVAGVPARVVRDITDESEVD